MSDFHWLEDVFTNLKDQMQLHLITNQSPALVESIEFFAGAPIDAIRAHLGTRTGSMNTLLIGFSPEVVINRAGSGEALSNNLPVSLLIIRSFEGRTGRASDFMELNTLHDAVMRAMKHHVINPQTDLGAYSYWLSSAADVGQEGGGWGGRRLIYQVNRSVDSHPEANLLKP